MARILIVAYTNYYQDSRVKRNAEALADRGDEVDVICLAVGPHGLSRGVNIIGLPMPRYRGDSTSAYLGSYVRFFAMASRRATRLSRDKRYDVVIVCTMPDAAVLCALGPKLYGAKIVLDIHDTMPELYQDKFKGLLGALGSKVLMAQERVSAWFADLVLAVHEPHRQRLARSGVPARKLKVVMNLPDHRLFRFPPPAAEPAAPGAELNGEANPGCASRFKPAPGAAAEDGKVFRLVCHGTITLRLGLDLAVQAVALVRNRIPAIHLHIIGDGDVLPAVKELTDKLGLQQNVTFTPSMPVEQLPPMLAQAAVGIVPNRASRATHLMLPAKLLEYATLGIPVIAARLETVEYYFPDDSVRYFQPGDVQGFASAIEYLYNHPEERGRLRHRAAQVAASLSWDDQRSRLFDTIDSLLGVNHRSEKGCEEFRPRTETDQLSQAGGQSCDTAKP